MHINILGTQCKLTTTTDREDSKLRDNDGYCDSYEKIIVLENGYNENHPDATNNFNDFKNKVKRREIIHAYLFESGLSEMARNEQLVDWLAWQFPKMLKTFQETDSI